MDARRLAPTLAILCCLLVCFVLAVPYFLVADATTVNFYYDSGVIDPLVSGLFCAVAIIVFAAGRQGRTDPGTAAGVALAFAAFVTLVSLAWALTVPGEVVLQLSRRTVLEYHRAALVVPSIGVLASGVWYARALSLV